MPNRELIIEAGRTERQYWKDLWNYRELFYFLAWRDILVRYKQTVIGILWALLRPLLIMLVFTVVFGKLAKRKKIHLFGVEFIERNVGKWVVEKTF